MTHFISTPAALATCPRCRLPIITAHDEGIRVRVDLVPLPDQAAEIAALLQGRTTYTRLRNGHLVTRDAPRIAARTLTGPTHADHRCTGPKQLTIDDLIGAQ
ncbi:hypothetical protein ABT023_16335 [Micromonospora sp. NPDC002296]|uniref:hypothetical protein n=1 Tax=Micromonospora sp. NPDC002296 TaxID=3154271 RepID=UPI0033275752